MLILLWPHYHFNPCYIIYTSVNTWIYLLFTVSCFLSAPIRVWFSFTKSYNIGEIGVYQIFFIFSNRECYIMNVFYKKLIWMLYLSISNYVKLPTGNDIGTIREVKQQNKKSLHTIYFKQASQSNIWTVRIDYPKKLHVRSRSPVVR